MFLITTGHILPMPMAAFHADSLLSSPLHQRLKHYWLKNSHQRRSNLDLGCLLSSRHTNCQGNLLPHLLPLVLNETHLLLLYAAVWLVILGCHGQRISLVYRDEQISPFADSLCDRGLVTAFQPHQMDFSKVSVAFFWPYFVDETIM